MLSTIHLRWLKNQVGATISKSDREGIKVSSESPGTSISRSVPVSPKRLGATLLEMLQHPIQSIVPPWSWKAAAFTALFRAATFFVMNLQSGERVALQAMLVEASYAIVAAGLAGAVSQQLRNAEPLMPTLTVVLVALPAFFVGGQLLVHKV